MAKIAIMGFGTVGAGVAEVARMNRDVIASRLGEEVYVKYILDVRDFADSPYADLSVQKAVLIPESSAVTDITPEGEAADSAAQTYDGAA